MADTRLNFGEVVVLEVKTQNVLLPALYPNAPKTVVYRGILHRRASYDGEGMIRLQCKEHPHVRVIALKNIIKMNRQPFIFTPPKTLSVVKQEITKVEVEGSKGKKYTITIYPTGKLYCSCPGFGFRSQCRHTDDYMKEHGK
jgi:hypothetical protein